MLTIHDDAFKRFGQVVEVKDQKIFDFLSKSSTPKEGNIYVASDKDFEKLDSIKQLESEYFGNGRMEAGYCNGNNILLNCCEYHDCIEIDICADEATLFLGTLGDIKNGVIDSKDLVEFHMKKGEAIILYPGTLHYSPCAVHKKPFHMGILLSRGTNTPLKEKDSDPKLWMNNKWLICHKDTDPAKKGAYIGIVGENRRGGLAE